jgi:hypothetical protein
MTMARRHAVHRLGDVHAEAVATRVGPDDGQAGLRDLAQLGDADLALAGGHVARLLELLEVEAHAAVVDLDDGAALHLTQCDEHLRGGRRGLRGVGQQLGHEVDERLDDARRDRDTGVARHLDPVERRDAAGGALDDVGQRERLAPLLARPLAAQGREALCLAGLLGRRVVDAHGGLQDVRVGGVALHHARRLLLDAVRGGLDLAAQGDHGDLDGVAAGDALLLDAGEHARRLVEPGLRAGVTREVRQGWRRLVVEERGQLLLRQGVERSGGRCGTLLGAAVGEDQVVVRGEVVPRGSRGDQRGGYGEPDGGDADEPGGPRGRGPGRGEQDRRYEYISKHAGDAHPGCDPAQPARRRRRRHRAHRADPPNSCLVRVRDRARRNRDLLHELG